MRLRLVLQGLLPFVLWKGRCQVCCGSARQAQPLLPAHSLWLLSCCTWFESHLFPPAGSWVRHICFHVLRFHSAFFQSTSAHFQRWCFVQECGGQGDAVSNGP
ncbi:hypothetical protein B0H63DRAFT_186651 [Podospora didyma]|uniref:Secreted protein n=1 Tax=Podospora didyma TaxID=330526 RepID=A0AAE0NQ84_9PEZI|nr:hypothetical protein B0H63DRAFT_186651 [Podospora didyma]